MYSYRDAGGGRAGGHVPPHVLGNQLTLFGPGGGADYDHHINTTGTPIFLDDAASLIILIVVDLNLAF